MSRRNEVPEIGQRGQSSDKRFGRGRENIVIIGPDGSTVHQNTRNSRRRAQEKAQKQKQRSQSPRKQAEQGPKEQPQSHERRQRGPRTP
jgi:hypothetical protein